MINRDNPSKSPTRRTRANNNKESQTRLPVNMASSASAMLNARSFYGNYYGHPIEELEKVHHHFRNNSSKSDVIWLAGDSSFDNKHWFQDTAPACNGYEKILNPPTSKQDITYWLNEESEARQAPYTAINCAVEETTIEDRARGRLTKHDEFIRDNLKKDDILCVSVGGNDIALKPLVCTVCNIVPLLCCTTTSCVEKCVCGSYLPCDDYLWGCTSGCWSNALAFPCGMGYMMHLFGTRVQAYLESLTSKVKPKKILICTIYYPSEAKSGGWADTPLRLLGYDSNPKKLQALIRQIYTRATSSITIPQTEVVPVPLFVAMDGTQAEDYCERAEPSAQGGMKMGNLIMNAVLENTFKGINLIESNRMER